MSPKIKAFLLLSTLLNIMLIGIIAGHMIHKASTMSERRPPFKHLTEQLPEEKREKFQQHMAELRKANAPLREETKQIRNEAIEILTAEAFDAVAYQKKIEELHALQWKMKHQMSKLFTETAKELNQEERALLSSMLKMPEREKSRPKQITEGQPLEN
ncbi:MAG: hypothetical protein K0R63_24 [Rickettsiales bacterium]|jgi:uncharacterized membrane protein|nr:hypothetical protein [Rickettsiales bacterium]